MGTNTRFTQVTETQVSEVIHAGKEQRLHAPAWTQRTITSPGSFVTVNMSRPRTPVVCFLDNRPVVHCNKVVILTLPGSPITQKE